MTGKFPQAASSLTWEAQSRFFGKVVSDYGMKMRVEYCVISKGVNSHHKTGNPIRKSQYCPEEDIQTLFRTMAKPGKQLSVVLEIDPEQNRDAENELPVRDGVFDCSTFPFCFKIDFEQEANLITLLISMNSAMITLQKVGVDLKL